MNKVDDGVYIITIAFVTLVVYILIVTPVSQPVPINQTITVTQTVNSTIIQTVNSTTPISEEKALYGVIFNFGFIADGGEWTVIYLMTPDEEMMMQCCNIYVFDGFVQGIPLGAKVEIDYREYQSGFERHLIVTAIQVLAP